MKGATVALARRVQRLHPWIAARRGDQIRCALCKQPRRFHLQPPEAERGR